MKDYSAFMTIYAVAGRRHGVKCGRFSAFMTIYAVAGRRHGAKYEEKALTVMLQMRHLLKNNKGVDKGEED